MSTTEETKKEELPSSGDTKFDALRDALIEKGVAWNTFMGSEESWRKRALGENYQELKDEHQWLYDQPITPKSKEEQEAQAKAQTEEQQPKAQDVTT